MPTSEPAMILTVNNDPTGRLTSEVVRTLAGCDDATTYEECGWFCVLGYKDGRRVVHAHANSHGEFLGLVSSMGYRWTGTGLVEMTHEERMARDPYGRKGRYGRA